jgi:hypothetical protein
MQNLKDIQYFNSNCCQQISNALTTTLNLYTSPSAKNNKIILNKIISPTFNFETTNIHHHSCSTSYKLLNGLIKIVSSHITICIKQNMLNEFVLKKLQHLMVLLVELMVYSKHQHYIIIKP